MVSYFLIVFGNSGQICDDLTSILGDDIFKMVEGDGVILVTIKSTNDISTLKELIIGINTPFIIIPKEQFKDIALNLDAETVKYLFNSKQKIVKKEPIVLDLNTILDKINKTGYGSLKKEEKEFLKTFS